MAKSSSHQLNRQLPSPGGIALVRQRRYLIERVTVPPAAEEATLVELSCLDDDAQGQPLVVLWEHELDARVLEDDGWAAIGQKPFDDPELFAAYLRTPFLELRHCNRSRPVPVSIQGRYSHRRLSARTLA